MLLSQKYVLKQHIVLLSLISFKEATGSKKKKRENIVLQTLQRKMVEENISEEAYHQEVARMKEYSKFKYKELKERRKKEQYRLLAMRAAIKALPEERKKEAEERDLTPLPFELKLPLETPPVHGYDPSLTEEAYHELSAEEVAAEKEIVIEGRRRS
eukprot:jgi/Galph1/6080/GphlegSOOS_G4724.1